LKSIPRLKTYAQNEKLRAEKVIFRFGLGAGGEELMGHLHLTATPPPFWVPPLLSALALAILADWLGEGHEPEARKPNSSFEYGNFLTKIIPCNS